MLTTEIGADLKTRAKTLGVKCWVLKPVIADRLLKAIELVMGSNQAPKAAT